MTDFNDWTQTSLTATSPLVITAGVLSIPAANSTTNGYLSSTDWNTFSTAAGGGISGLSQDVTTGVEVGGVAPATVVGINDTLLSSLATGILMNTTGTGVPSIVTIGASLSYSTGTLDTLQALLTTSIPTFAGVTLNTGSSTVGFVWTATSTGGAGSWQASSGSGSVTSVAASVPSFLSISGSPITSSGTLAISYSGTALPISSGGTNSITTLNDNRIMISSAGKIIEQAALTPLTSVISDANGLPVSSSTTSTEIGYVHGVTSSIQNQLNAITSAAINSLTTDVVATGPGASVATIQSNVVTNSKLAQMATETLKGNNTGSMANASDLTVSEVVTMLGVSQPQTPTENQYYYVAGNNGDDVTGDGTYNKPFATVSQAMSLITTNGQNNRFIIKIISSKLQEPSNIVLKPYVYIVGDDSDGSYIRINGGSGSIVPDVSWTTVGGGRSGISNIYLGGGTSIDWDLYSIGPNTGTPSCNLRLDSVTVTGNFVYNGRVPDIDYLQMYDTYVFGTTTFDALQVESVGTIQQGLTTLTSTNAASNSQFLGCSFLSGLIITASSTNANIEQLNASSIVGTLTITDSASYITLLTDVASYPIHSNISITGNPTITFLNDAYGLAYTPSVSGNWSPVPSIVSSALDQLAARSIGTGSTSVEQIIALDPTDITNQYIDLSHPVQGSSASINSIQLTPAGGIEQQKTVDYTVSLTGGIGGVTRITFAGGLATGGSSALVSSDILQVYYAY